MRQICLLVSLFATTFWLSCKKEGQVQKPTESRVQITTTDLFFRGELDYERAIAQIAGEKMRMVVPVKNIDGQKSYRYKISEFIKDGDPSRSGFIISLKEITKETDLFAIPINSKGSIFSNGKENSLVKDQQGRIVAKVKSDKGDIVKPGGEVLNLYAGCGELPPLCIDWYFVSYDVNTGQVVSEIYVYTSCYDPCSFNNNPSGGDASGVNCSNVVNELKSGPVSTHYSIEPFSEDLAAKERKLMYKWTFHKQNFGMWEFRSIEIGTHKQQPDNTWRWKSMEHQAVTRHGWTAGGTITCTINAALPQVGLYFAGMQLDYTINACASCKGFPISNDINGHGNSPIWHVNQTPVPLY